MLKRIVFAALVLAAALAPAAAMERIERFVSDVDVQSNGDLLVTETIQVRAERNQIRRGILRDFPTTYHRRDGSRVEVGFAVNSLTRDGNAEPYHTEKMSNGVRVKIGSADTELSVGSHTYVIRYRTTRQIGFFENYDELYWNATGNGWTFIIDSAEARITLPQKVTFQQTAFYTGPQGATGKDATIVEERPGLIVFRTTKVLPVANGLTVAAAFSKGVVIPPTQMQKLASIVQDDPAVRVAAIGGGLVFLYYLLAWLLVGRDPARGTIIPLFGPPDGMSAAAVRFVEEMRFDDRVFSAAIVGLGVNGHLKMIDRGGGQELQRIKGAKPLDAAEQAVKSALFVRSGSVSLIKSNHEVIGNARSRLDTTLQQTYRGTLFRNNFWWSGIGMAAAVAMVSWIALAYSDSYGDAAAGILVGMFIPLIPIMAGVGSMRIGAHQGGRLGKQRFFVGLAVIVVSVAIGVAILAYNAGTGPAIWPALVTYALAPVVARGFTLLQAASKEGRKVMDQIEGFKQYLSIAEEDRLNALNPPEKTPELFERFLPYAIALDCENAWAKRFTGVLAAAGVGAAVSAWYAGSQSSTSDLTSFTDRLGSNLSQTIASAATPPGSTGGSGGGSSGGGSSGGGSSGGGGGGGGGSGW